MRLCGVSSVCPTPLKMMLQPDGYVLEIMLDVCQPALCMTRPPVNARCAVSLDADALHHSSVLLLLMTVLH